MLFYDLSIWFLYQSFRESFGCLFGCKEIQYFINDVDHEKLYFFVLFAASQLVKRKVKYFRKKYYFFCCNFNKQNLLYLVLQKSGFLKQLIYDKPRLENSITGLTLYTGSF